MTRPNVRGAFVRGCRRVLLCERRSELDALCKGFTFDGHMELSLQVSDGRRRDLGGCYKITDAAVTAVAAACPQLTSLDLGGCCKITDVAVTARAAERANSVRGAVVCHSHGLAAVPGQRGVRRHQLRRDPGGLGRRQRQGDAALAAARAVRVAGSRRGSKCDAGEEARRRARGKGAQAEAISTRACREGRLPVCVRWCSSTQTRGSSGSAGVTLRSNHNYSRTCVRLMPSARILFILKLASRSS